MERYRCVLAVVVVAAVAGCPTVNTPHGPRQVPPLYFEAGMLARDTPARFRDPPERVDGDDTAAAAKRVPVAATAGESADTATATAAAFRFGAVLARHLVLGWEAEVGSVRSTATDPASTGSALHLGLTAVVGATARVGRLSGSAELVAGTRSLERHAGHFEYWYFQRDYFLESRVRLDLWILPWISIGVYAVVDDNGLHAGGIRIGGSLMRHDEWR